MAWNYPGNVTGLSDMFIYVSNEVGQIFPLFTVISIFIISFVTALLGQIEFPKALAFSSLITLVLSSILWAAGFVPGRHLVVLLVLAIFGIAYGYIAQD